MVMGLLAKLLLTKQLKFEDGLISLKDITMTLVPSSFIGEMTKYFMKEDNLSKLYLLSWFWGYILVKGIKERFNLKRPDEIYSLGMDFGEAMGIGLYKTHDYYPGRYTHFIIMNNPYLKYILPNLKKRQPIDYFVSGCMAGGGCLVHNAVCQNVELKCVAAGNQDCEFLTGTEQELKTRNLWEITVKRYDLKKVYPLQKEIFETHTEKNEAELMEKVINTL